MKMNAWMLMAFFLAPLAQAVTCEVRHRGMPMPAMQDLGRPAANDVTLTGVKWSTDERKIVPYSFQVLGRPLTLSLRSFRVGRADGAFDEYVAIHEVNRKDCSESNLFSNDHNAWFGVSTTCPLRTGGIVSVTCTW